METFKEREWFAFLWRWRSWHGCFRRQCRRQPSSIGWCITTGYPNRFLSLTVLPGIPPDDRAFSALDRLKGIPLAAFVGGEDSGWVRGSRETKEKLDRLGIENTLDVVPGAGHVIALDPGKLFDLLDKRR